MSAEDRGALCDRIGGTYAVGRRTDPRIAARIHAALGDARTVVPQPQRCSSRMLPSGSRA